MRRAKTRYVPRFARLWCEAWTHVHRPEVAVARKNETARPPTYDNLLRVRSGTRDHLSDLTTPASSSPQLRPLLCSPINVDDRRFEQRSTEKKPSAGLPLDTRSGRVGGTWRASQLPELSVPDVALRRSAPLDRFEVSPRREGRRKGEKEGRKIVATERRMELG